MAGVVAERAAPRRAAPPRGRRDLFIDLLRAASLLIVVAGHWLGVVPFLRDGIAGGRMLYDAYPAYWPLSWLFAVIPLFFFVGGFANFTSYGRQAGPGRARRFLARRLRRLVLPTLALLGAWAAIEAALNALDLGGGGLLRGMRFAEMTPFAPLWFLGVYLGVVVLTPASVRLHLRFGAAVPAAIFGLVAVTDAAALGLGVRLLLTVNLLLVWLLPHQLGYFYADGRLRRLRPRTAAGAAAGALAALLLLLALPDYTRNLLQNGLLIVGTTAPTLPFAVLSIGVVAAALALREPIRRALAAPRRRRLVEALNGVAMTVFLWHMTAYFGAILAVRGLGLPLPPRPDLTWWAERPLFLLLPAALLVPLVRIFARLEGSGGERPQRQSRGGGGDGGASRPEQEKRAAAGRAVGPLDGEDAALEPG